MAKNGLGKGLGDLMDGDQVAGKGRIISASAPASEPGLSRGLSTLISAHRSNGDIEQPETKRRQRLPAWFFFAADILLLAYVVAISMHAPRPFDFGTILFCAVSVALGCALAVAGVLRD
jgi:hypothetical protein